MEQAQEAKHEAPLPTKGAVFKVVCNSKLRAGFSMTSADKGVVKVPFLLFVSLTFLAQKPMHDDERFGCIYLSLAKRANQKRAI